MSWLMAHWVDLLIIAVAALHVRGGWRRGFIATALDTLAFVASIAIALISYAPVGDVFTRWFDVTRGFAKAAGFVIVWMASVGVVTSFASSLQRRIPKQVRSSLPNKVFGGVAAAFDGVLLAALVLSFLIALPFSPAVKRDIAGSALGGGLVRASARLEAGIDGAFGGAVRETLSFVTVRQGTKDSVDLRFTTEAIAPDGAAEEAMLALVNEARAKQGIAALVADPSVIAVARAHSADMLRRGYFSHVTPEGQEPADRADEADVRYRLFGENIAYAPDVTIAFQGFMDSPGHRANILNPDFGRIGLGIQNAGAYGLMITQNFAD